MISRALLLEPPNAIPIGRSPLFAMCVNSAFMSQFGVGVSVSDSFTGSQIVRIGETYGDRLSVAVSGRGFGSVYTPGDGSLPRKRAVVEKVCGMRSVRT